MTIVIKRIHQITWKKAEKRLLLLTNVCQLNGNCRVLLVLLFLLQRVIILRASFTHLNVTKWHDILIWFVVHSGCKHRHKFKRQTNSYENNVSSLENSQSTGYGSSLWVEENDIQPGKNMLVTATLLVVHIKHSSEHNDGIVT